MAMCLWRFGSLEEISPALTCLLAALCLGPLAAGQTLRVDPSGGGDAMTIAEAIARAEVGATIRIAPGTYRESLVLDKGVRLLGSGWDSTVLLGEAPPADLNEEQLLQYRRRYELARTDQERKAVQKEIQESTAIQPLLDVRVPGSETAPIHIEGLKLTLLGEAEEGRLRVGSVVRLRSGITTLSRCVVAGSPANGIELEGLAQLTIRDSLVCGIWNTGIRIIQSGQEPPPVVIRDTELRNCRYAGLTIGGGENVLIEGCWIRGAAWHGIRYDGGSPRIQGNLIAENQRSGIYASGKTAATIQDNLLLGNGSTHWFESNDRIAYNTFASTGVRTGAVSTRCGVAILGRSQPQIVNNVFYSQESAIFTGDIGGSAANAKSTGVVVARNNLFWMNERVITRRTEDNPGTSDDGSESFTEGDGNEIADPGFIDAMGGDYGWLPGALARSKAAGSRMVFARESRWPPQKEEAPVANLRDREQDRTSREARTAQDMGAAKALARPWIDDIMQLQSVERRARAVESMQRALESPDPTTALAGLLALTQTLEASYDREPFAKLARNLAGSTRGQARVKAFYALQGTAPEASDLELLLHALEDAPDIELLNAGTHLLSLFSHRNLKGRAGAAALRLLQRGGTSTRDALGGIWGARVSDEIEAFLIELADNDPRSSHDAIYFGLSTLEDKSTAVIERLFAACESSDQSDAGRALWGLGRGIPEESRPRVADFCMRLFQARSSGRTRKLCLDYMGLYGTTAHLEELREISVNELAPTGLREAAQEAIEAIESR